jgi:hypothetical protein
MTRLIAYDFMPLFWRVVLALHDKATKIDNLEGRGEGAGDKATTDGDGPSLARDGKTCHTHLPSSLPSHCARVSNSSGLQL